MGQTVNVFVGMAAGVIPSQDGLQFEFVSD